MAISVRRDETAVLKQLWAVCAGCSVEEPSCAFMCFSKRSPHLTIWKNPLRVPETPPALQPGRGSRFRESHAVRRNRMQRPAQDAGVIHDSLSWRGGGAGL
jgi:hypothetical protein